MNNLAINPAINFGRRNPQTDNAEGKSNKSRNLKIAAAVVGTAAAVTAGVVYRKNIMDFLTTGFKKVKNIFSKKAKPATIFDDTPGYSKDTKKLIKNEILNMFSNETIDAQKAARKAELKKMRLDAINAFKNMDVQA